MCVYLFVQGRVSQEEEAEEASSAVPSGAGGDLVSQEGDQHTRALPLQLQRCGQSWCRQYINYYTLYP